MKNNTLLILIVVSMLVIILSGLIFYKNKINIGNDAQTIEKIVTKIATSSRNGNYLVDNGGFALYVFSPNPTSESACDYNCLKSWKPFIVDMAYGGNESFLSKSYNLGDKITIVKRSDGLYQYAYDNKLLYKFIGDIKPTDTNGLNIFNKNWKLINL